MSDRIKEAFDVLVEEMDEPPTWEELRIPQARPGVPRRLTRPAWVAVAAFVAVILFGAVGIFLTNTPEPASVTVPYVRLDWSQHVEMRCEGMEIVDNGGFENALIEIWGPTSDNMIRVDAIAPDGVVETLITEMDEATGRAVQAWATHESASESVFRVSECTNTTGSESVSMADPPFHPRGGSFPQEFVGFPDRNLDGSPLDLAEALSSNTDTQREDSWRGTPVTVYVLAIEGTDEFGTNDRREERWVDLENQRFERYEIELDIELLGDFAWTIETTERSEVSVRTDLFSTDDLIHTRDITGTDGQEGSAVTTTLKRSSG